MPVSPEMMNMMSQGPQVGGPAASPMPSPQEAEGKKAQGMASVTVAVKVLETTVPVFGADSEEGAAVLKALGVLGKITVKHDSANLAPAELRNLIQSGGGGEQEQMMKMLAEQNKPQPPPQPGGQPPMGA